MGGRGASYDRERTKEFIKGEGSKAKAKPIDIKKFEGQSLEQIEGRLRKLNHEELFALDANDKLVAAYKGNKDSVAFPIVLLAEKDATVTHGHPKGAAEFGGTLSFADVRNMTVSKWKEHRATASGQGEMNYILRRNSKSNPRKDKALYTKLKKDEGKVLKKFDDAYIKAYKKAKADGKTPKQAIHVARQAGVGEVDKYWAETLPKYGYDYIKRKKDYKYNR